MNINDIKYWMAKHPYDWALHCGLCAIPNAVLPDWRMAVTVLAAGAILEYEQYFQPWYNVLSAKEYFKKHAAGDLIADTLGILIGLYIGGIIA